jgi:hypothetical protein
MAGKKIHKMGQIARKGLAALMFLGCTHQKTYGRM